MAGGAGNLTGKSFDFAFFFEGNIDDDLLPDRNRIRGFNENTTAAHIFRCPFVDLTIEFIFYGDDKIYPGMLS